MTMQRTIHSLKNSRYLTQHDVDTPQVVTVREVIEEEIVNPGTGIASDKNVIYFDGLDKGDVLGWEKGQLIAQILGSESFDDWPGCKVVIFRDPSIRMGSEIKGGIRYRAPKRRAAAKPVPQPEPIEEEFDDDIPFGDESEAA